MRHGIVITLAIVLSLLIVSPLILLDCLENQAAAVSRSSAEAKLRTMAIMTAEVTWLRWLLEDFDVIISTPTPLSSYSTGAISIARDPVKHELTKHIDVDASYMQSQVHNEVVPSEFQVADFFTKA
jgi:hypothetical protein